MPKLYLIECLEPNESLDFFHTIITLQRMTKLMNESDDVDLIFDSVY